MTTVEELGWTPERAAQVRAFFEIAGWAEDWDDPAMDVYDDLPDVKETEENTPQ